MTRALRRALATALLAAPSLPLGGQTVDPRGDFRTVRTPHFRVHFPRALEAQGRRAAAAAEGAWKLLAGELAPPRGPVDLVLADNADVSNGFASTFPANHIVVFAQPPVDASSLRFYDDWLQLVITHELTHVFHLDRSRGVWRGLQYVFGRNPTLFPNTYGPSWLTEGLAVYFESRLTGSGRLVGTEHRLIARAAALDARVPRIDQLSLGSSVYPLGERAYAYGSLLVDYVARASGPERVRTFVDRQATQLVPWRLDRAAERSFGLSFSEGWRRWRDSVVASVRVADRTNDAVWRPLTTEGWFAESPRWLDTRRIVYAANDGRSVGHVEQIDVDGARRSLGRRNSLSPNVAYGRGLLFAQLDYADPWRLRSDLYVQDDTARRAPSFGAASAGIRRLTRGARLSRPDARADGAIVAVQTGGGTTWLVRVDPATGAVRRLTTPSADTQWTEPRWSPRGDQIVATRLERGGWSAIAILDTLGALQRDLVHDRAVNSAPAWAGSLGTHVLWTSDRTGRPQLYLGSNSSIVAPPGVLRVSDVSTGIVEPAPSRDGNLAALLFRADGYHVALADSTVHVPRVDASTERSTYADSSRVALVAASATGRATRYAPWRSLLPRYWSPVVGTSDGGDVTLGGSTSGTDVLGRHAYFAQATVNAGTGDVEGGVSYRYAGFAPPFLDVGASQSWTYDSVLVTRTGGVRDTAPLFHRTRAVSAALTFTRPRVRTSSSLSVGAVYERRAYTSTQAALVAPAGDFYGRSFPALFASASWSNARRPTRSISPEDGIALGASVQHRWQDAAQGPRSLRATGAARVYKSLDLPGFAHHVLALRVAAGATDRNATTELSAGGVSGSSAELLPGLTIGDPARTFPVRGFGAGAQRGIRAAAASLEYRAPLALPARGLRLLPVFADRLSIAAFADAGSAWCPGTSRADQPLCASTVRGTATSRSPDRPHWLASVGAELGLDAALSYDAPYRFRLGVAAPVAQRALASNAVSAYLSLGLGF